MFRISILTVGDEICIGQVVNTNAAWIAQQCSHIGAHVHEHAVVGDDPEAILAALNRLQQQSDCILMTGGLGPTHDDITKDVLCTYFNDRLVEDAHTLRLLQDLFTKRNRELTERNKAQALIPSKAIPLANSIGSAPGLLFERDKTMFVAMPGVPNEMKAIMNEQVLSRLHEKIRERSSSVMMYKTIIVSGIAESSLADILGDPDSFLEGQQLAFLPSYSGVRLRISVHAPDAKTGDLILRRLSDYIYAKAARYIIGEDSDTLPAIVHRTLIARSKTLALAESCTGGMLGMQLTDNPGSSAYFLGGIECYSNESKIRDVGVHEQTIIDYGAVSNETAEELALKVREKFCSDYALAITGIAGPDGGTPDKPVGTVWIAIADATGVVAIKNSFGNDRAANRERSCAAALMLLLRKLQQ